MSPSVKATQHCLVTALANKQTMFWTTIFFFGPLFKNGIRLYCWPVKLSKASGAN